jgi:hypothetical protein
MARYELKVKPPIIQARQWDGTSKSTEQVAEMVGVTFKLLPKLNQLCFRPGTKDEVRASVGDYVILTPGGEIRTMNPKVFERKYARV